MKENQLIQDKVYHVSCGDYNWIVKNKSYINITNRNFSINSFNHHFDEYIYTDATYEEKMWLEECIKQNKFIPLNEIITKLLNYEEIY